MSESQNINREQDLEKYFFRAPAEDFKKIPGNPIAYWVSKNVVRTFDSRESLVSDIAKSEGKNVTTDNARFIRFFWEVSHLNIGAFDKKWLPCAMGGDFRKWYGNIIHTINWSEQARDFYRKTPAGRIIRQEFWGLPGVTWGKIGSVIASFRFLSIDEMYQETAVLQKNEDDARFLLGLLNSKISSHFLQFLSPTINFQLEDIGAIPLLNIQKLKALTKKGMVDIFTIGKADWDGYENSRDFTKLPLLDPDFRQLTLKASYQKLRAHWRGMTLEMQRLEQENNLLFIDAYGLQDELRPEVPPNEITLTCNPHYRYGSEKSEAERETLLRADTMRELVSYAVGCMFGRYSLDKPGLILANQGETLADYLDQVPQPNFPADGDNVIPLLGGDWFPDDITLRFRQFLRVAFGDAHYEDNLAFIEQALNVKGKRNYGLRDYFLGEFYTDHVKRYKKRPIYWLFSSPKGTFNALVYLHRYRPDTVSVVLNYLRDFRKKLASRLDYLQQVAISPSTSQGDKTKADKEAETIKKQLLELDDYERETLYPLATKQVELDLDDGVKVNYLKLGAALKKIVGLDAKGED
ncbi:BREX-1 system adenine-specific DNA-methyltransferase PglX [Pseudomonas sp. TNT2022 ID642]|uniref:BREX-1 system adenine-specific DNA-methyltransferase PglX n=1 Tax=Pseudomonas sp. TNT2022 ID642 TaxID=2942632 RepID=UPI002361AE8B|nr:BREX-1 system adenine-specific DNA-methyltransferase PglX [Pseudomonas sp. TNT2022 ID642]MDD1004365.1 BREX-1 system adenine-specific DNA-methyltransferase PglX [Pseudomonas sp. TNT2022 ID642]